MPSAKRHEIAFSESIYFHFFVAWKVFLLYFHFADDDDMIQYELPMRYWRYIYIIVVHAQYYFYSIFSFFFAKGDGKMEQKFIF